MQLDGGEAAAEAGQLREPGSTAQVFVAGSVGNSGRPRLLLCGEPRFDFGSPGPEAEKATETQGQGVTG